MLTTVLLPEKDARLLARQISMDLSQACQEMGIAIVGGHTEITKGLDRPIVVGTIIGEVEQDQWITPQGARSGDLLLLTKRVPIEMIAILGRDAPEILLQPPISLSKAELIAARDFLYHPGISIQKDVMAARSVSGIHAMHDPTEGGLYSALWELAEACGHNLMVSPQIFQSTRWRKRSARDWVWIHLPQSPQDRFLSLLQMRKLLKYAGPFS